jgi:hypothetical protein
MHGLARPRLVQVEPVNREKTWIDMRPVSGATPLDVASRPATMPATWVP